MTDENINGEYLKNINELLHDSEFMKKQSTMSDFLKIQELHKKSNYWKTIGATILGEELKEKWEKFVDDRINDVMMPGEDIEETIQILGLIKSGASISEIANVLEVLGSWNVFININLTPFVSPEIIDELKKELGGREK